VFDSLSVVSSEVSADLPPDVDLANSLAPAMGTIKFTDAIRWILKTHGQLPAPGVRDELIQLGFDFAKYKQELVPVHNTLRRLEEQGEVQAIKNEQGQTISYKWISPLHRALAEEPIDPAKLPSNIAAAIYGGTETASADNQPRRKISGQRIAEPAKFEPKYGQPDPLNQRKK
jgi:hypothetical protein